MAFSVKQPRESSSLKVGKAGLPPLVRPPSSHHPCCEGSMNYVSFTDDKTTWPARQQLGLGWWRDVLILSCCDDAKMTTFCRET